MNDILFYALQTILVALVGAIVTVSVKYVLPIIKLKLEKSRFAFVESIVETGVLALEEQVKESEKGSEKKAEVVKYVSEVLANTKIKITDDQLSVLIDSIVKSVINSAK